MDIIKTSINGLEIHLEKVLGDSRGLLAEMIPSGAQNDAVSRGIGNIYASIATGKHIGRAAHYHFKNHEIFFTLSGTALWLFHDFRKDSPTFGKIEGFVLGFDSPEEEIFHPIYVLGQKQMARVSVPAGVYHAFWPLSEEKVTVVAVASVSHDDNDYWRGKPEEVPGFKKELAKYGINI